MRGLRNGFTLVELTAVLLLLGLLAALSLPAFVRGTGGVEGRLCRDQIWRDVKSAMSEAVAHDRRASLSCSGAGYCLDRGFGEPIARRLPAGFTLDVEGRGEGADLVFEADGTSNGARLTLTDGRHVYHLLVREDGSLAWE